MTTGEHSERGNYVTKQVALWLANESAETWYRGDFGRTAEIAANHAWAGDLNQLQLFATHLLHTAQRNQAAWHVQQELAPNDFDRIRWADVAEELKATFDQDEES